MAGVEDDGARWLVAAPSDRDAWATFLAEVPAADPLQSWAWAEAGMATGERWERLVVTDTDGRVRAAVQWQLVSPVLGHPLAYAPHGPVWQRTDEQVVPAALRAILGAMRERCVAAGASAILLDPRSDLDGAPGANPGAVLTDLGFAVTDRHVQMPSTRVLDLTPGLGLVRAGFDKDTRNLVRRSAREGVEVAVVPASDPGPVAELHRLMLDAGSRGGFLPRSEVFMRAYGAHAHDHAFVALGRWRERVIAGALVGMMGERAYYQFAGSLRTPELRHANAPYAVMDRIVAECVARGVLSLDLCGVNERDDPGADPRWEGLSSFKRGFGGVSVRHPAVATLVLRPGVERIRGAAQMARQRLAGVRGRARRHG